MCFLGQSHPPGEFPITDEASRTACNLGRLAEHPTPSANSALYETTYSVHRRLGLDPQVPDCGSLYVDPVQTVAEGDCDPLPDLHVDPVPTVAEGNDPLPDLHVDPVPKVAEGNDDPLTDLQEGGTLMHTCTLTLNLKFLSRVLPTSAVKANIAD